MPVPVVFTSITPRGAAVDQAVNVPENAAIILRIEPEIGNGAGGNGGPDNEAAMPVIEPMVDASGFVLPQYARLYKTSALNGSEISGTDVPLKVSIQTSAFLNNRPTQKAYFDLYFTPAVKLDNQVGYAFEYSPQLPGSWRYRETLDYGYVPGVSN